MSSVTDYIKENYEYFSLIWLAEYLATHFSTEVVDVLPTENSSEFEKSLRELIATCSISFDSFVVSKIRESENLGLINLKRKYNG